MDFDSAKTKKRVDKLDTEKYFFLFFGPHFFCKPALQGYAIAPARLAAVWLRHPSNRG
jgi:hypothetical protein